MALRPRLGMKLVKKMQQDRATHVTRDVDSNDPEEVVVPSVAALVAMLLTGFLYLALPPNVVIGPNGCVAKTRRGNARARRLPLLVGLRPLLQTGGQ